MIRNRLYKLVRVTRSFASQIRRQLVMIQRYEAVPRQFLLAITATRKTKNFTKRRFQFSHDVSKALKAKSPRPDKYILERKPEVEFIEIAGRSVVKIDRNYTPIEEIRIDNRPYEALSRSLRPLFLSSTPKTFLDIGCTSGNLMSEVAHRYGVKEVYGVDVFEFLRDSAPREIQENIMIADLRFNLPSNIKPASIVTCLEIAEHIDPNSLDQFLSNVRSLTKEYLVMSWSSSYPRKDAPPQHLSPLWKFQYRKVMNSMSFKEEKKLTKSIRGLAKQEKHFHEWWRESLVVWSIQNKRNT
jgi:hypothetical protein